MKKAQLEKILYLHKLYLLGDSRGAKANLQGADLRNTNLQCANLQCANLQCANLQCADLRYADLRGADLRNTNLQCANLQNVTLQGAGLQGTDLWYANLRANLRGADLRGADLPAYSIVPESGSFMGWKKCRGGIVIKIKVLEAAERVNPLGSRKCRASGIKVVAAYKADGTELHTGRFENWRGGWYYEIGVEYWVHLFDDDIRVECARGIHFFMTREEAERW